MIEDFSRLAASFSCSTIEASSSSVPLCSVLVNRASWSPIQADEHATASHPQHARLNAQPAHSSKLHRDKRDDAATNLERRGAVACGCWLGREPPHVRCRAISSHGRHSGLRHAGKRGTHTAAGSGMNRSKHGAARQAAVANLCTKCTAYTDK